MQISNHAEDSLRQRKKAQVRADLERATLELALDRDLDDVTVDEICARVPVSHRTFFNYFDSKEDAVFDIRRAWGDDRWIARSLRDADGSVIEAIIETLFRGPLPADEDPRTRETRMLIAARHPGLLRRRAGRLDQLRAGLVRTVAEFSREVRPDAVAAAAELGVDAEAQAELLVIACIGAVRIAVREWADAGAQGSDSDVARRAVVIARTLAPFAA